MGAGRLGRVEFFAPAPPPHGLVFLFSDAGGWSAPLEQVARRLVARGAAVVGVDLRRYLDALARSADGCHYVVADLEELSHRLERETDFLRYRSAYVLDETLAKETLSPRGREAVARELEAIERTRDELDQLLTQELRSGSHEQTFGLMALARECGADIAPLASTRGVTLSYVGDEQRIRGDRLRLKQAITNVLRNAIEAAPAGSNVSVDLGTVDSEVHLAVRDQGPGLSLSARSHLFEPLFTEKTDGLGMGLYVARAIVEAHGGSLALVDTGRGTQAEIHLVREAPHPA